MADPETGEHGITGNGIGNAQPVRKARGPDGVSRTRGGRYSELGTTGLRESGGFIHDETLPALAPGKKNRVWREMDDNDPVIGSLMFAIEMLVRQVEWRVDPADGASVAEMVAERQNERAKMAAVAAQAEAESAAAAAAAEAAANMAASDQPDETALTKALSLPAESPGRELAKAMTALGMDPSRHAPALTRLDNVSSRLKNLQRVRIAKAAAVESNRAEVWNRTLGDLVTLAKSHEIAEMYLQRLAKATAPTGGEDRTPPPPSPAEFFDKVAVEGEEDAVFIETCFHDMENSWEDTLAEILTMLTYGFAFHEIVYKRRNGPKKQPHLDSRYSDGMVGWRNFAPRSQDTIWRWDITPEGRINGVWQIDPYKQSGQVYIPSEKGALFRTTVRRGNPEGRSILRNAYRPWVFKKRIEEIEAIGIERDLAGFPVAYVPYRMMTENATPAEVAALDEIKDIVSNIKRDEQEGAVFPNAFDPETGNKLYELTLLSTGGSRQFDTDATVARYDQRIAMTVLADFILLGHEKVGSFSLGQVKSDLFTSALEAWLDMVSSVFNASAIPRLRRINNQDPAASPTLTHGKLNQIDLGALGEFLSKISAAGAPLFPDDNLEAYLRQAAGLPDKAAEITDLE